MLGFLPTEQLYLADNGVLVILFAGRAVWNCWNFCVCRHRYPRDTWERDPEDKLVGGIAGALFGSLYWMVWDNSSLLLIIFGHMLVYGLILLTSRFVRVNC